MWRTAPLPKIVALLLVTALSTPSAIAANGVSFGVHLTVRESCEVRTRPQSDRMPAVDCRHGRSFAVSRHNAPTDAKTVVASREMVAGAAMPMWVVTF